jgi:hypothetical protein
MLPYDSTTPRTLPPVGARVVAISHITHGTVWLLGSGSYLGLRVPEAGADPLATLMGAAQRAVPAIELDAGGIAYDFECWWGADADLAGVLSGRRVTSDTLSALRERNRQTLGSLAA